jgi:ABC-type transport system involved in multi-copper enzyme maturation permease subunit
MSITTDFPVPTSTQKAVNPMFRSELYKIRTHRTPLVLGLVLMAGVLAAPVWMFFSAPTDPSVYFEALTNVFTLAGLLIAVVFGGWMAGHEFRQGTIRRVVAIDARRGRLLATKATAGLTTLIPMFIVAGAASWAAMWAVANRNGFDMPAAGIGRELLAGGAYALLAGSIAYGISVITRSDVYGMLGTLAAVVMFAPLLELIPTIGNYMPSNAFRRVTEWMGGPAPISELSLTSGLVTTAAYVGLTAAGAVTVFRRRDI